MDLPRARGLGLVIFADGCRMSEKSQTRDAGGDGNGTFWARWAGDPGIYRKLNFAGSATATFS
jgi:hypothetical protein